MRTTDRILHLRAAAELRGEEVVSAHLGMEAADLLKVELGLPPNVALTHGQLRFQGLPVYEARTVDGVALTVTMGSHSVAATAGVNSVIRYTPGGLLPLVIAR